MFVFWMVVYFVFLVGECVVVLGFCLIFEKELKSLAGTDRGGSGRPVGRASVWSKYIST